MTWFWLHTVFMFAGIAGLVVAAAVSMMYLVQSAQLKSRHPGKILFNLPALNTLDKLHFRSLALGVLLFSFGILSGVFWAQKASEFQRLLKDPAVLLSLLTCFLYWVVFSFRASALRRGQKIAVGTVLIFLLLFVTYISLYCPAGFHKV